MPNLDLKRLGLWLVLAWIIALVVLRGMPQIDLMIAAIPYHLRGGFDGAMPPLWEWLRQRIWDLSILLFLLSMPLWAIARKRARPILRVSSKGWALVFWLYLLGPVLLVNAYLKSYSGRARPRRVEEFGGDALFTPAFQFTDQCDRNCSFVSGEVAAAVALALLLWLGLELWKRSLSPFALCFGRGVALFIAGFITVQRIAEGRHFLSDAVFAGLFTLTIAWGLCAALQGDWPKRLTARLKSRG